MQILNKFFKNLTSALLILVLISFVFSFFFGTKTKDPENISLSELSRKVQSEEIKKIEISDQKLLITDKNDKKFRTEKEQEASLTETFTNYGVKPEKISKVEIVLVTSFFGGLFWLSILVQVILPFLLIFGVFWYMSRQAQKGMSQNFNFGRANVRLFVNPKEKTSFKDVAGLNEAKEELREIVDFLKNSKKFIELGARIPRGVLLMGSPGTGKTLLARAVAGEAQVPFFHISGSEFVELFVGVGASRVRDLFVTAKKNAPCIVFIDEIDAVGRQRGSGLGGSHDEREQTLNQILVEMDGFDPNQGVIVLAATNRPDVLDPALLRPGRFDRRVILDEPDINDREAVLKIHAKNKPLTDGIDLRRIAERTPGFSGADLANLMNEAAILAARRNKTKISMSELTESIEKVMLGPERKSYLLSEHERRVTAYHEAGHALVAHRLPDADPIHKISIISRGSAAGYTLKLPIEDRRMHRRAEFLADLAMSLGGYVAEQEIFGRKNLTTGASSDLRQATRLARRLVTDFGMSDKLGPRTYGEKEEMVFLGKEIHHERDYSEKTAELIDSEINQLIADAKDTATQIISEQRLDMEKIVELLLKQETIEKEEFEELLGKKEAA